MKLLKVQPQMIIRSEMVSDSIDSKYIIYQGLGHIVLDSELLKSEDPKLFKFLKEEYQGEYFFRISFMEDPTENKHEVRCYITKDLQYFKAKKISKSNNYCFLGIDFTIISLERISQSTVFSDSAQYHCIIRHLNINDDGEIVEEVAWDKTKYGAIEKFLPRSMSKYAPFIESNRLRISRRKEK